MDRIKTLLLENIKIVFGVALTTILIISGFAFISTYSKDSNSSDKNRVFSISAESFDKKDSEPELEIENTIFVDVQGAVNISGVVKITHGKIVNDLIDVVGGFREDADLDWISKNINRAAIVQPNSYIYIPTKFDTSQNGGGNSIDFTTQTYASASTNKSYSTPQSTTSSDSSSSSSTSISYSGTVNINTASLGQLDTLSGIGSSKAQAIIDYRNTVGPFNSPSDIMKVSGIGSATYEKNKSRISV